MNQIIKSFLDTHIQEYEISEYKTEKAFEHFINRLIVNKYTTERFDPSDILSGKGEIGLDGIAIVVNSSLVLDADDLDEALKLSETPDVRFIFIQAKTSEKFDGDDIGTFCFGVKCFFETKEKRPVTNEKIEKLIAIKDIIYSKSIDFPKPPVLELYYVCCGKWNIDNNLTNRINIEKDFFENTGNFSTTSFFPYDNDKIITSYKELKKKIVKKFKIERKFSFPSMDGIKQAYSGLIKCTDFIELLKDSEGEMLNNIFEDNVRDFQGYNQINKEIQSTIRSEEEQEYFAVLNNGITILCKKIELTGDEIEIFDYQIVNGCQTSNILFSNKEYIKKDSYILAKIIEAKNEKLLDRIIFTTNRQTEVKSEAFASTKTFHKGLEDYYNSVPLQYRLYYERRSKQYERQDSINKNKVVTLPNQIFSYLAAFLNEPHSTHRYYGELLEAYSSRLFIDGSLYEPYYIASYLSYYVGNAIRSGVISKQVYSRYRYHIVSIMKAVTVGKEIFALNSRKLKQQCEELYNIIKDANNISNVLDTSICCLDEALRKTSGVQEENLHRSRELTATILEVATEYSKSKNSSEYLKVGDIVSCVVTSTNQSFAVVELKCQDEREKGSIHISKIACKYIANISDEIKVGDIVQARILNSDYYETRFGWELTMLI